MENYEEKTGNIEISLSFTKETVLFKLNMTPPPFLLRFGVLRKNYQKVIKFLISKIGYQPHLSSSSFFLF